MGRLIYIANTTLDGYTEDRRGDFGFTVPTAEVFSAILDLVRPARTYLYGRRMYETMAVWDRAHLAPDTPAFLPGLRDLEGAFADAWRGADKIVYSTTLAEPSTPRTRIERAIDPDHVRRLVAAGDVTVGGPHLAAAMLADNLVTDLHAFVAPISVGGGKPWLPLEQRIPLELADVRRMGSTMHIHYRRP